MKKETLVSEENIYTGLAAASFEELIQKMSLPLIETGAVSREFPENVIKREKLFPTGLPTSSYGAAIPHTDPEYVLKNTISVASLKEPIEMNVMGGTKDDKVYVSIVFLLALGESNKQLNILKKIMNILKNENALGKIKNGSKDEILEIASKKINLGESGGENNV